jgi:hypothetical protein
MKFTKKYLSVGNLRNLPKEMKGVGSDFLLLFRITIYFKNGNFRII